MSSGTEPWRLLGSEQLCTCKLLLCTGQVPVTSLFGVVLPSLRTLPDTLPLTVPAGLFLLLCSLLNLELDAAGEAGTSQSCALNLGVLAPSALTSLTDVSGEVWMSVSVSCPRKSWLVIATAEVLGFAVAPVLVPMDLEMTFSLCELGL